jgi:hypothetical protein
MKYFFDLPVYRLNEEDYYCQRDSHIDRVMYPPDDTYSEAARAKDEAEPHSSAVPRRSRPPPSRTVSGEGTGR